MPPSQLPALGQSKYGQIAHMPRNERRRWRAPVTTAVFYSYDADFKQIIHDILDTLDSKNSSRGV